MKCFCIADEDTVRGFRLAGVAGQEVHTPQEAAAALATAASNPDCGMVIITEQVATDIRPQLETLRLEHDRPLVVEIPGSSGPLPGQKSLRQLVQEAVGIRLSQGEGS